MKNVLIETCDLTVRTLKEQCIYQENNSTGVLESLGHKTVRSQCDDLLFVKEWEDGTKEYFYNFRRNNNIISNSNRPRVEDILMYDNCYELKNIMTFGDESNEKIVVLNSRNHIDIYDKDMISKIKSISSVSDFYIDNDLLVCTDIACRNDVQIFDRNLNHVQTIKCNRHCYEYVIDIGNNTFYAYDPFQQRVNIINADGVLREICYGIGSNPIQFLTYGNEQIRFNNVRAFFKLFCGKILIINNCNQLFIVETRVTNGEPYFHVVFFHKLNQDVRTVKNLSNDCFEIYYYDFGRKCLKIERFRYSIIKNTIKTIESTPSVGNI